MGSQLIAAGDFLIKTLFDLYIMAVLLRFLLQLVRADFYNPVSQFLVTVTNPVLVPLRRYIPGYAGIDNAAIVLMLLLEFAKYFCLYLILYQIMPNLIGLLLLSIAEILKTITMLYFFTIIIQAVISWVNPGSYNPAIAILYTLTEPVLKPARKLIPPIGGLDISPMLVLIAIQLINMLIVETLIRYGMLLSVGINRGI